MGYVRYLYWRTRRGVDRCPYLRNENGTSRALPYLRSVCLGKVRMECGVAFVVNSVAPIRTKAELGSVGKKVCNASGGALFSVKQSRRGVCCVVYVVRGRPSPVRGLVCGNCQNQPEEAFFRGARGFPPPLPRNATARRCIIIRKRCIKIQQNE